MKKRFLSAFMALCMMVTLIPNTVYAQATTIEGNLCEHHIEHTTDCGYTEGTACTHDHDGDCGYVEDTPAKPCKFIAEESTPSDAVAHEHDGECGFAEAVIGADCAHQHTADCGYTEGIPCTFKCVEDNPKDSGNVALGTSSITVTAFDKLEDAVQQQTVPVGTELTALDLPTTLSATGYTATADTKVVDSGDAPDTTTPAAISIDVVKWELDPTNENNQGNSTYDPEQGAYCFTPILPEGYTTAEGVALPEIWVMVDGAMLLANPETITIDSTDLTFNTTTCPSSCNGHIIKGTSSGGKIIVENGTHNITLSNAIIDVGDTEGACAFNLNDTATVSLTLVGDNKLVSGQWAPGLRVINDASITIGGEGKLLVQGGDIASGIGGG